MSKNDRPKFEGFIECMATPQNVQAVKDDKRKLPDLFKVLHEAVDRGYKFGLVWSDYNKAYQATLLGNTKDNPNAGWCLTALHADPLTAIRFLLIVHEMADGMWEGTGNGSHDW